MKPICEQVQLWHSTGGDAQSHIPQSVPSYEEALDYCRELATSHYENFPLVSWLLPKRLHAHFYSIYAFCRWADDLGDEIDDCRQSLELLGWWRSELEACFRGECRHPVFVALRSTIQDKQIPIEPFTDLISAFEQDQTVHEYDTFEQLLDYCTRSANPVGRLLNHLWSQSNEASLEWSDSICTGLQLANFWQDVDRDLSIGRIYLPREDREKFGVTREMLESRQSTPEFLELMKFEVDRARKFLVSGASVIDQLPLLIQIDIELFAAGGLCVLDHIRKIGYRVLDRRPVVSRGAALKLLIAATVRVCARALRRPFRRQL
ncbi:MAG: squalene synthase HpnC [Planctomycetaceae bacterium]